MKSRIEKLVLKTSQSTGKSWLVDEQGKRCSKDFKVRCHQRSGNFSLLITDIGTILYSKYNKEYKLLAPDKGIWLDVIQLSEKIYLVGWKKHLSIKQYCLFDENLKPTIEPFDEVKTLTANLIAIKKENGWGIAETMTGTIVVEPCYVEIEEMDGKIIGKIWRMVETEIKIND